MTDDDGVTVAAFDVDGTLTTRDCVVPFLRRFSASTAVLRRALLLAPGAAFALASRDRDRLRSAATSAVLRGVPHDEVEREARAFAEIVLAQRLRADTVERLGWHNEQGHHTVLVSASYEVYLTHIAAGLGAGAVLGTRLEVDDDRRCTGRLLGANCRAGEKPLRLGRWLDERGLARSATDVWAYGDSRGDRELLAFADHPVWAGEPLASVAPTV